MSFILLIDADSCRSRYRLARSRSTWTLATIA